MCAKKKTAQRKVWKLAGEPVRAVLTAAEQKRVAAEFLLFQSALDGQLLNVPCISRAKARVHESAAQAAAAQLCHHYAGRFKRENVIKAISAVTALPGDLAIINDKKPGFLLGAALWLLNYLESTCEDPDEYLNLLPDEEDEEVACSLTFSEILGHSWGTVVRMVMVLTGRDGPYRKTFLTLLELVDKESKQKLRNAFKDSLLDYLNRLLTIRELLDPAELGILPNLDRQLLPLGSAQDPVYQAEQTRFFHMIVVNDLIYRPVAKIQKCLHTRKASELLADYGTDDPYTLCAAYLLLEREGDALANMNVLTAIVMTCAERHLPWYQDDLSLRAPLFEAQLFFLATGVALPRDRRPSGALARWFMEQGMDERRAGELAWAAFMAYYIDENEGERDDSFFFFILLHF